MDVQGMFIYRLPRGWFRLTGPHMVGGGELVSLL